jgi:hypothetical protein
VAVNLLSHPAPTSPVHARTPRQQSDIVRVADLVDTFARWQSASSRAKRLDLRLLIDFNTDDPRGPEPYRVSSASQLGRWYHVSDRLICECPAGQHGHVCVHVARVVLWWQHLGSLRQCAGCGQWDHASAGGYEHVGGDSGPGRWFHNACVEVLK